MQECVNSKDQSISTVWPTGGMVMCELGQLSPVTLICGNYVNNVISRVYIGVEGVGSAGA